MPSVKNITLLIVLSIAGVTLAGCGNKGPLVRPSDIPAAAPVAPTVTPADADEVVDPAVTPAPEPAAGTPAARR